MILDRVQSANPVHVESRVEREYGDWMLKLVLIRPTANDGKGTATFELVPHDYDSGESLDNGASIARVDVNNLEALATRRPALRAAINAIAAAVADYIDGKG